MLELAVVEKGYSKQLENDPRRQRPQDIHDRAGTRRKVCLGQSLRWRTKSCGELP